MKRQLLALVFLTASLAGTPAASQALGHLGVPGLQHVYSGFAPVATLPSNQYYLQNVVHPDGTVDTMSSSLLVKQTLVYMDFLLLVYRNSGSTLSAAESGEIYLADWDSSQKNRTLQDQWPLARFTIPANEQRAVLQVSLPAGRSFSGYRQPMLVLYAANSVNLNGRALGYLLPN